MRGAFQRTHTPVRRKWKASAHGSLHKLLGRDEKDLVHARKEIPHKILVPNFPPHNIFVGHGVLGAEEKIFSSCQNFIYLFFIFFARDIFGSVDFALLVP